MAEPAARAAAGATHAIGLAGVGGADTVALRELPLCGYVSLRLDPRDRAAIAAAASVIGAAHLPLAPNTWVAARALEVLWQAYDEWLFVTPDGTQAALTSALCGALPGSRWAVTDVSDLRAAFEVRGAHARDVLQKGCAIDLHDRAFPSGACGQTALARVRVTLRRMSDPGTYQALVERSYARYLWEWLVDASLEYRE